MIRLLAWLLCGLAAASIDVRAANDDDGFVWVDANTKIRLQPIGKAGGSAAAGGTKAPEPKKEKKETPKK